jgi:hypothetical protein
LPISKAIRIFCYVGKIIIHPTTLGSLDELWTRAAIGPLPGEAALTHDVLFHFGWITLALVTHHLQTAVGIPTGSSGRDTILEVAQAQ